MLERQRSRTHDKRHTVGKLDRAVTSLPFSKRVKDALAGAGLTTFRDLALATEGDLYRIPGFGKASVAEIRQVFARYRLNWERSRELAKTESVAQPPGNCHDSDDGHPVGHNGGPPLDPPAPPPVPSAATILELNSLLSKAELAKRLGVHERTLDRWGAAGLAPPRVILPGRRVAFRPESVAQWIRDLEASSRPPPRSPGRPASGRR